MSTQDFSLGKGKSLQTVNLSGFKGGVKREQLQTEQEKSIFDALDTNKDGIIDEKEMQALTKGLQDAAGKKDAENLSNGEAKDFLKEHGLKKIKKEDLFKFVKNLSQNSENIKECATDPETGNIVIEYNDGSKETIRPDKTSVRVQTDDTNKTTTTQFNANNEPVEESVVEANGKDGTATIYQLDAEGNPIKDEQGNYIPAKTTVITDEGQTTTVTDLKDGVPTQKTVTTDEGKTTDVTTYENGIPKEQTITKEGSKTVIQYDENGQPKEAVETQGEYTVKNFVYINGEPREMSRVENKGQDTEKTTTFQYNEDGTVLEQSTELGGTKKTARLTKDGKPQAEEIIEGDKKTQREYKEDGSANEIIREGENITQNQLNPEGNRLTQVKVVDGKQYQLEYDGNGNTEGIIVQNGESPAAIAKKFGVPLDKLLEANSDKLVGKGKNSSFRVGDSIKIPREMEADEKVLNGRKSSAEAIAEYQRDAQIRAQKRAQLEAENAALKELGLKNRKGAGSKVKGDFYYKGKKTRSVELTKIGNATYERTICKDSSGKIYIVSKDGVILKESWVKVSAHRQHVVIGNQRYAIDGSRGDKHGRINVIDADGNTRVLSGGKSKTDLSDRVILRNDYVQASDAYDATGGSATITGKDGVKYVKDESGKVWYVDAKTGNFLVKGEYSNFVKQEADAISDKIYKAAKGWGTDEDKLKEGVGEIYSPEILAQVNSTLASKDSDYKGDSHTMPIEALILDEETHGNARPYFQTLINSGAMTTEQKGNTIARELKHEVEGGLGYTSTSSVNEVMNLVPHGDRETRLAVENSLGKLRPDLVANEGSLTRAYLAKDGWTAQEVDQFDSNWVANNSYQPGVDQEHRNGVIGRLCFEYDDKEALHKGLKACSDDPNSEDYQYLTQRAIEANKEKGYQTQFTDQEAVQTYLAGRSNDGGEVDVEQLSACNTLLFKASKPPRVQAEEALYGAKKGDMSNVFDSMDSEVYDQMADIMAKGDIPGCKTVKDAYNKAYASAKGSQQKSIKANAILSGHVEFSQQEITNFCIELMHSIDDNKGKGGSTGYSAEHTNDADYQTEQLKAILTQHPEIIADVKAQVEKGKFISTTTITTGGGPSGPAQTQRFNTDNKAGYLDILNNTQCIVKDEVFLDENGNKITDPALIADLKQRNMEALSQMRDYVAQLEREFKMGVDEEGWLDDTGNALVRYSGIGTDRGDVANKYREAKNLLKQLEAAAQGKLRDSKGNVISAQQLAQNIIDKQDGLAKVNTDYKSSVGMAKMGIVLAPVIVVTTVATAGIGATGWAAVGVGAATTAVVEGTMYGTNLLTSETGNTAENRAAVTSQVLQDTALAAAGIKVGQYAENFAVNGIKAVSMAERSAFTPQTWKIISKVPEGKIKDFFGAVSKASAKIEQASADVGASVISKQANLLRKVAPGINETQLQKAAVILARGEAAGLEITSDTIQTLGQMYLIDGEFSEEGFIQGMIMSVAGNSIGHATSLKGELSSAGKPKPNIGNKVADALDGANVPKQKTPVLDGIIGDGNKASGIRLGAEKVESVRGEINKLLSETDLSGADLADAYSKLNKIGNRDLRRELQGKITKAADGLTGAEKSAFQAQRAVQLKADVDKIVANKTVLEEADVRVINDYIKNENDITALQQLQEGLQQKRAQHRGTTANYDKLGSAIDKKIKSLNASGEGVQGAGGKVGSDDGAKVSGDDGAKVGSDDGAKVGGDDGKVGSDDGAKVGGDDGAKVSGDDGAKVGGDDGAKVGGDDGAKVGGDDGAKVGGDDGAKVGGDDGKVGSDDGAKVGSDDGKVGSTKPKILEENDTTLKIEINGQTIEISKNEMIFVQDASGTYVPKIGKKYNISSEYLSQEFANPQLAEAFANTYKGVNVDAEFVARIHDLDQALSMIDDAQMKQLISEEIANSAKNNGYFNMEDLEFLVDAQNAFEARSAIMKSNDYKGKSAIQRFNDYLRNDNLNTNDLLNNSKSSIHGNEVRGLKADIKLENRLYGVRQYMKQHPNSPISNHMYSKYLDELTTIGVDKSIIDKCRHLDSEYGCKVMVSANLKEASEVMNYLEVEFNQWKAASGGQAKFPPVIDFSTVKSNWYDTGSAYGQSVAGAYSEPGYNGSLAFPGMSESGVAWAMRHEMTHTNDLKHGYNIPPQYDLNRIMPKKPKLDSNGNQVMKDGQPVMVPDFENCMFVDEFRKAGISEDHISYAYNNTAEFIAVASEGDLSKCSPQFRQMLVDFGMPEWQLNMKPKTSVKTKADTISAAERRAFADLEVRHYQSEHGGISGFFNRLLGNDIREQGSFTYKPPRLDKIASKDLDISGIYIGNRVNVMGDMLEGKLPKNKAVIVAEDAKIRLADSWTLDLADPQIKKILDNLEEGRTLTVGRQGNIQCSSGKMGISDNHLEIRKVNGEIVIRDISKNGAEILGNTGINKGVQLARRMKNYVSGIADAEVPVALRNKWKKCKSEISDLAASFSMPDININTAEFKAKYHSIMNDLSTIASKASAEIKQQLKQLMDKIKEMFNSMGISAKNNASVNPNITGRPDLDKYVLPQNKSLRISSENRDLARSFGVEESHVQFIQDHPELFKDNHMYGYWQGNSPADQHHGAWKMHMFSVDEADWQKMSQTLIPYLNEHGIEWKTLNMMHDVNHLNGDIQQGKAFTIYPRDNAHMEQVARDLDYIIRRNNLDIDASNIIGDRQMGGTGRLFYRYEFNTKQAQNEILDLSNEADYRRYRNLYDSNEGRVNRHGEGSYLADDMTAADDPWLNFDPSNAGSKPGLGQRVQTPQSPDRVVLDGTNMVEGSRLPKGQGVAITSDTILELPTGIELDLSSPQVQARLKNLQDGQSISIGRNTDNDIQINNQYVSGHHLTIQKQGDRFIVIDNSTNGTKIGPKLPELDENELVRVAGNNGNPIDANYIRTSREARSHLNQAIATGDYTRDLNSYIETINSMHEIAYHGKNGKYEWYSNVGQGSLAVNPGVIRKDNGLNNNRLQQAQTVEGIARQYGDPYRVDTSSAVKLDGIPDEYLPKDLAGGYHFYPAGHGLEKYYYKEMHRTSKEALNLIESGASKQKILEKLAEHYQYAANARPYGQINNSLFMNEINTLLTKAGMPTIPHGELDIAAMHLQPKTFKKFFVDQYKKTALSTPKVGNSAGKGLASNSHLNNDDIVKIYADYSNEPAGTKLPKGEEVTLSSNAKLLLSDSVELDLSSPEIQNKLKNLKDGETLSVGRNPDCDIVFNNRVISDKHLTIEKFGDDVIILDNSTNGTSIGRKAMRSEASSPNSRKEKLNKVRDKILDELNEELKDPDNVKEIGEIIEDISKGDYDSATEKIVNYFGDKGYEKITGMSYSDVETFTQDIANIIKDPTNAEHFMKLSSDAGVYIAKQEGVYIDTDTENIQITKFDDDIIDGDYLDAHNSADDFNNDYDLNNDFDYGMNDSFGDVLFNEAPMPSPAPTAAQPASTAKVSVLNDIESKYLPKYTQHAEATTNVLNEIAARMKNGEIPSQDMLQTVLRDISEQSGISIKELEIDFDRCFRRNILGSDWQGIQKSFKTSEAKMLENIETGSSLANRINNFKTKRDLLPNSELNSKQGINPASTPTNAINTEQIQTTLSKSGLSFDAGKNRFTISAEKRQLIQDLAEQKLGGDKQAAKKFIENLPQTLKSDDIANIQTMLNSCDGKYSTRLLENPDELLIFYSNLKNSGFFKYGEISDAQWKAVFNLVENPLSSENLGAIMRYKGAGFAAVNKAMTEAKINGRPLPEHIQKEIDTLQNCISGQKVSDSFLVYRTEGIEFLDNFNINIDGQNTTLAEAMKNCKTEADRLKLMEHISKNNYTAAQERFTSTSLFKPSNIGTNDASMIVWELEVQPGSQGIYIEGANYTGKLCREREFLLQKNSNIEITGMKFGDDGKWHLQGKISNTEMPQQIKPDILTIDLDGADNIPTNNKQNAVHTYRATSNPDAPLKEYSYTKNGQTFKFKAADGIDAKNFQFLANMDSQRRVLSSQIPKFNQYSDNTQIRFAKFLVNNPSKQLQLKELLRTVKDEASLVGLLKDKQLLGARLNDITELQATFKNPNDFNYLGGLLDVKTADPVKYQRISDSGIFELIKDGKVDASSLKQIGQHADLSPEIYSDLALLKAGKSIVPEFPKGTDLKTAFAQTKVGDAVEVGNKMYINDGNNLIEWNMSKEKYLELFPPVQRFTTNQETLTNCHLIQTLGLAMQNPKARAQFLQSFQMRGNDIIVTVKGLEDYHGSNSFPNGEIKLASKGKHLTGCKGLQMYEQTYSKVALRENTDVSYPGIASINDIMTRSAWGHAAQTMADVFGKGNFADMLPTRKVQLPDGTIRQTTGYSPLSSPTIPFKNKDGKTLDINLNNQQKAATKIYVFNKYFEDFPNKTIALRNITPETTEALLTHTAGKQDFLISFGTVPKSGAAAESTLLPEYNIISSHAYSVLGYDASTKTVKIGNPHSYSEVTEIPLETLHKYIGHLDFLKL